MTDVHARIADALLAQFNMFPSLVKAKSLRLGALSEHLADVLLSLPGIAVVELPEAQETNGVRTNFGSFVEQWHHPPNERIERSISTYEAPTLMRVETARQYAAALLAAADAAEATA